MSTLRIAVVGAGAMGQSHMAVMARNPDCQLHAIADPSPAAQVLARQRGVPWFAQLPELLSQGRPDGVIVATPNALHMAQALLCMQAKVPVLVEKPIAAHVDEAEQLVRATRDHQAVVLIGHHRAHSPIMAQAAAVVRSGVLGRLVCVQGSATFYKPDDYFEQGPWRRAVGGGPLLINLIHEVHNLRMLCGEVVQVQAMASNSVRGHPVEDTVVMGFQFANGVLGGFLLSDCAASTLSWEQSSHENKAYAHDPQANCYHLMGTQGQLAIPTLTLQTFAAGLTPSWHSALQTQQLQRTHQDPLDLQLAHFVDVIQHRTPPLVSAQDGLQNLRVTQAVLQAAQHHTTVHVHLD